MSGRRCIADLRNLSGNGLFVGDRTASADAFARWLGRSSEGAGYRALRELQRHLLEQALLQEADRSGCVLDVGDTLILSDKAEAKMTYVGEPGFMATVGFPEGCDCTNQLPPAAWRTLSEADGRMVRAKIAGNTKNRTQPTQNPENFPAPSGQYRLPTEILAKLICCNQSRISGCRYVARHLEQVGKISD